MGKKFVGLGGLKHFWTKAKTWIAGQITAEVTAKIAEIVANAPENLDTLKEIADWISTHANDASAMNTQINTNKNDIAALQTSVAGKAPEYHIHDNLYYRKSKIDEKLSGKSDTEHKHSASDITSGTLPIERGGTGQTTANAAANSLIANLPGSQNVPVDSDYFISQVVNAGPFVLEYERRPISKLWEYIKGKADSIYAALSHTHTKSQITDFPTSLPANGGTADTATTAAKLGRYGNTGLPMTFNWSGQGGQPSWLWGGNDGSNMYVYNPSNFNVNSATTAYKIRIGNSNPTDGDIWIQ